MKIVMSHLYIADVTATEKSRGEAWLARADLREANLKGAERSRQ